MAEPVQHLAEGERRLGCWFFLGELVYTRFFAYFYDYMSMRMPGTKRYRELTLDHLVCRFCGEQIDLLGSWRCECGYSRPGNYFGRCPKCMRYPRYIDCPACGFTMDVR